MLCKASRLNDEDLAKNNEDFLEKIIQNGGDWEQRTLRDCEPQETVRLDTVTQASEGDRVEVYFSEKDKWVEGEVVSVNNGKHEVSKSLGTG
jgi:hypothetical protein